MRRPAWNPVLRREALERWRGRRATWVLSTYLGVLGAILYGLYRLGQSILASQFGVFGGGFGGPDPSVAGPLLGRFLVEGLLFFLLLLVLFITPGYAASQLAGERERRTLPLLQVTMLRPSQIVLGKIGASVAWTALLVLAAVPFGAAAAVLGGVDLGDFLAGVAAVVVIGTSVAGMAVGISSLVRKTSAAIVLSYGLVLALVLGTGFLSIVEAVLRSQAGRAIETPIALRLNPFLPLADAVDARGLEGFFSLPSPLSPFAAALPDSLAAVGGMAGGAAVGGFRGEPDVLAPPFAEPPMPEPLAVPVPEAPPVEDLDLDLSQPSSDGPPDGGIEVLGGGSGATPPERPSDRPLTAIGPVEHPDIGVDEFADQFVEPLPVPFPQQFDVPPAALGGGGRTSVWWSSLLGYALLGALGAVVATRRLRTVRPRRRTRWGGFVGVAPPPSPRPPPAPPARATPPPPPSPVPAPPATPAATVAVVPVPAGGRVTQVDPPASGDVPIPSASVLEPGVRDARPDDVWDPGDDS